MRDMPGLPRCGSSFAISYSHLIDKERIMKPMKIRTSRPTGSEGLAGLNE